MTKLVGRHSLRVGVEIDGGTNSSSFHEKRVPVQSDCLRRVSR